MAEVSMKKTVSLMCMLLVVTSSSTPPGCASSSSSDNVCSVTLLATFTVRPCRSSCSQACTRRSVKTYLLGRGFQIHCTNQACNMLFTHKCAVQNQGSLFQVQHANLHAIQPVMEGHEIMQPSRAIISKVRGSTCRKASQPMQVDPYHTQLLLLVRRAGWLGVQVVKVSKLGGLLQKIYTARGSCRSTHSEPDAYTAPLTKQQMVTLHLTLRQKQAVTSSAWAGADLPHCF